MPRFLFIVKSGSEQHAQTGTVLGAPREEATDSSADSGRASAPFALLKKARKTAAASASFALLKKARKTAAAHASFALSTM
jgi:hypothetical protein